MDRTDITGKPEEIRRDIDHTRASLNEKLGRLEDEVKGTVRDAKGVVEDGLAQAREMVSLSHQVSERPWTFFAGSILMGAAIGHMLTRNGAHAARRHGDGYAPTLADRLVPMFDSELKMIKGAAFTMLIGMMRDVARETIKPALAEVMDGAMGRLMGSSEPAVSR